MIVQIIIVILLVVLVVKIVKMSPVEGFSHHPDVLFVSKSDVDGVGVFTRVNMKKGDIVVKDIFQRKSPLSLMGDSFRFNRVMEKFNHCTSRNNVKFIVKNGLYHLVAIKDIQNGTELTANYDEVHREFIFIAPSVSDYNIC
jgi:hypothetical protein